LVKAIWIMVVWVSNKGKPVSPSPKRPLNHSLLFSMASALIARWSLSIYPDRLGPYLSLVTFLGVWLAWFTFFGVLYGPVEAKDGDQKAKERGSKDV
jgi:hypothetical protein